MGLHHQFARQIGGPPIGSSSYLLIYLPQRKGGFNWSHVFSQNNTVQFIVFGIPEPSLNLFKHEDDGIYWEITNNKFKLTLTTFSVKSILLEDAGSYRIWGNNTYGNSSLDLWLGRNIILLLFCSMIKIFVLKHLYIQEKWNVKKNVPHIQ